MEKEKKNHQRPAGLQQLQAQWPRLAVKKNAFSRQKTNVSKKGLAPDERLGDISSVGVHDDPMGCTHFSDTAESSTLTIICSDGALVNEGTKVPKSCLSPVNMRKSTTVGDLLNVSLASTYKTQGTNFLPQPLPWSFGETMEERNIRTTARETFDMHSRASEGNRNKI